VENLVKVLLDGHSHAATDERNGRSQFLKDRKAGNAAGESCQNVCRALFFKK